MVLLVRLVVLRTTLWLGAEASVLVRRQEAIFSLTSPSSSACRPLVRGEGQVGEAGREDEVVLS